MADLDEIRKHLRDELQPAHGQRGKYICPLCHSGTGAKGTAALSVYDEGRHWKCFSCNECGDIFDLISKRDGVSLSEATKIAKNRYGGGMETPSYRAKEARLTAEPERTIQAVEEPKRDFKAEIQLFHEAIKGSEGAAYLAGRGITEASMERFRLGYDAQRRQVIIPYNAKCSYYGMRNIAPDAMHAHDKPKGITAPLFNAAALRSEKPCYVVESPLCAISIMQEGGNAVALGGTNLHLLQAEIEKQRPAAPLLLALDNDQPKQDGRRPGQDAAEKLSAWLTERGIAWSMANVAGDYKDPNEALQKEPEAFRQRVISMAADIQNRTEIAASHQQEQYKAESAAGFVEAFINGVQESKSTPPVPTGFYGLDKMLDGGLYEGLYIVGAISSLGKTSFVLQMCDQIAAAGRDVLFFSLEMSRYELMAKSISRYTKRITDEERLPSCVAKTTRGILTGKRYDAYSPQEVKTIAQAIDRYKEQTASHIWFIEGMGDISTAVVRAKVENHIKLTGRRPVVVIDYLQILLGQDSHASDKQNTDRNVMDLKLISRDFKIPVMGISSLNRDNYTEPINTAAFKESGAIEYGSDCLIGLQYVGMEWQAGEKEQARNQRIRELFNENNAKAQKGEGVEIEIRLLKNRNGSKGTSDPVTFYPMFNLFEESQCGCRTTERGATWKPKEQQMRL